MSDRADTCVRLLVEGRDRLSFFRVLLIATDSFDAARHAARRFLEANGAQLASFDEEETAIVTFRKRCFSRNPRQSESLEDQLQSGSIQGI